MTEPEIIPKPEVVPEPIVEPEVVEQVEPEVIPEPVETVHEEFPQPEVVPQPEEFPEPIELIELVPHTIQNPLENYKMINIIDYIKDSTPDEVKNHIINSFKKDISQTITQPTQNIVSPVKIPEPNKIPEQIKAKDSKKKKKR